MTDDIKYVKKLVSIARRFYGEGEPISWDDVEQSVLETVVKTRKIYDSANSCKFASFAYPYIQTAIKRNIKRQLKDIDHLPDEALSNIETRAEDIDSRMDTERLITILDKTIDSMSASLVSKKILKLIIRGCSYSSISEFLGVSRAKIITTLATNKQTLQDVCSIYYGGLLDV